MKKSLICVLIICMLVVAVSMTLISCNRSGQEQAIVHNDEILSKYGDAFVTLSSTSAPSSATEYTSLPRVTKKFVIDGRIIGTHTLGLYMPQNEQVTFTIDASEIGNHHEILTYAFYMTGESLVKYELDSIQKVETRGILGGMIELDVKEGASQTFTLTVSGCIELPCYRYGIDELPTFKDVANYNILECSNLRVYVPSGEYKNITKADKAMNWWRNALILMDELFELSFFGNDYSPICIYFQKNVDEDEIISVEHNSIRLPYSYIGTFVDYDKIKAGDNYNILYVLKYIAQEKAKKSQKFEDTFLKDAIVDIVAQLTYIDMVDAAAAKYDQTTPEFTPIGNTEQVLRGEFVDDVNKYLALFTNLYYSHPYDVILDALMAVRDEKIDDAKMLAFISNETQESLIPLAELLGISLWSTDMEVMRTYKEHSIVANKYTIGQNANSTQTGLHVNMGETLEIDFADGLVGRGDWTVSKLKGTEGRWKRVEGSKYIYTPSEKLLQDKFDLVVKNGDKEITLHGNITVDITVSSYELYNNVNFKTLQEATKGVKNLKPTATAALYKAEVPKEEQADSTKSFAISKGAIEVAKDGEYTLYLQSSGICSVEFGVKEYYSEIFTNQLTLDEYRDELSYTIKLEKGYTYIYTIYNLSNKGSGFAKLGIKAPGGQIEDITEKYLIYPSLKRANIVDCSNPQHYREIFAKQAEEYSEVQTAKIAQLVNIKDYEIGQESEIKERGSIVSFVLPLVETSTISYVSLDVLDMQGVKVKVLGGPNYSQLMAEKSLDDGLNVIEIAEKNLSSIKFEFTSDDDYKIHILDINAGQVISAMTIVPSTSTKIEYIGEWTSSSNYVAVNGRLAVSLADDAVLSYSFNGDEVSIYAAIGPEFGTAKITIDGQDRGLINLSNTTLECSQLVYTAKLSDGDHTIIITATDDTSINFDYIAVSAFGETENKNDFSKLWFIAIIPGVVLIAGIVFIGLDINEKKKRKEEIKD